MYHIEQINMPDNVAYIHNNVTALPTLAAPWPTSQILTTGQPIVFTTTTPTATPTTITTQKEVFDANTSQAFCLRWNNYQVNLLSVFDQLLKSEQFVDVTLACEGAFIKAHKMVLSACSPYFQALFADNPCQHPVVIMNHDIRFHELKAIVDFMYKGEINVVQDQIGPLLRVAETLKIRGLADVSDNQGRMNAQPASIAVPSGAGFVGTNMMMNEVLSAVVVDSNQDIQINNDRIEKNAMLTAAKPIVENPVVVKTPRKAARNSGKRSSVFAAVQPENLMNSAASSFEQQAKKPKSPKIEAEDMPVQPKHKGSNGRKSNLVKKNPVNRELLLDQIKEETQISEISTNDDENQNMYQWLVPSTSATQNENDEAQSSDDTHKSLNGLLKLKAPSWTPAQLREAISSVVTQKMRFTQASLRFNIPKGTLYDNILGKSNRMDVLEKSGLNANDENSVLEFCCDLSVSPYNRRTRKPLSAVLNFVMNMKNCNRVVFDEGGKFGFRWWWAFCKKYSIASMHYDGNANLKHADKNL